MYSLRAPSSLTCHSTSVPRNKKLQHVTSHHHFTAFYYQTYTTPCTQSLPSCSPHLQVDVPSLATLACCSPHSAVQAINAIHSTQRHQPHPHHPPEEDRTDLSMGVGLPGDEGMQPEHGDVSLPYAWHHSTEPSPPLFPNDPHASALGADPPPSPPPAFFPPRPEAPPIPPGFEGVGVKTQEGDGHVAPPGREEADDLLSLLLVA